MIRVIIEIEHYDGEIVVKRDDSFTGRVDGASPPDMLKKLVAAAEASALAALTAKSDPR
jgi:hypothetical protein